MAVAYKADIEKIITLVRSQGEAEGYRRAIRDIKKELVTALDRLANKTDEKEEEEQEAVLPSVGIRRRAHSDQSRVLGVINQQPGLRGYQIAEILASQEPPVHERTMRTALNRLKRAHLIYQDDSAWYPNQEVQNRLV